MDVIMDERWLVFAKIIEVALLVCIDVVMVPLMCLQNIDDYVTRLRPNAGLILGHCLRRWTSAWSARHVSWDDRCKESHWGGCYKRLTVICCPHQFINVSQYTLLSFWSTTVIIPANTIHWTNVLMLGQRRRRWLNSITSLVCLDLIH